MTSFQIGSRRSEREWSETKQVGRKIRISLATKWMMFLTTTSMSTTFDSWLNTNIDVLATSSKWELIFPMFSLGARNPMTMRTTPTTLITSEANKEDGELQA